MVIPMGLTEFLLFFIGLLNCIYGYANNNDTYLIIAHIFLVGGVVCMKIESTRQWER